MRRRIELQLLGGFHCALDGAPVTLPTRKAAALLALLAMQRGAPVPRERIADLLWSRSAEPQARGSLRQAVAQLRRALDDPTGAVIQRVGSALRLAPETVAVDVWALEQALTAATPDALQRAAGLYRGALLAGLAVEDAGFQDWQATEATRLQQRTVRGLQGLLEHLVAQGDLTASLELGEQLLRLDPLAEETYQALMRLHLARGTPAAVMREYERCRSALAAGLGVAPSSATETLRQSAQGRPMVRAPAPGLPARVTAATAPTAAPIEDTAGAATPGPSATLPTIAVLPFTAVGDDADTAAFATGFTIDVVSQLARFRSLRVISAQSSFAEAALNGDPTEVATRLGARYLLLGHLRRGEDRLRLNLELLDASARHLVWSHRTETTAGDLFATQDAIGRGLAAALAARIDDDLLRQSRRRPLADLAAYDCWLRGMALLRQGTLDGLAASRPLFRQALALDPALARACSGLSLSYFNDWSCVAWARWDDDERLAFEHARDGAALDDSDHITQFVLGRVLLYRRDFEHAERHLDRAEALNPNDADMLAQLGATDAFLGHPARGVERVALAMALNPCHDDWYSAYAVYANFIAGRLDDAIAFGLKAPEAATDVPAFLAAAYAEQGALDAAQRHLATFHDLFRERILHGQPPAPGAPARWLLHVNPFRHLEAAQRWAAALARAGLPIPDDLWRDFPYAPWPG